MSFLDFVREIPLVKYAALATGLSGAITTIPRDAGAQEVSYSDFVENKRAEDDKFKLQAEAETETYFDEEEGRTVTRLVSERKVPLDRGQVSNSAFYFQGSLRTEAGIPFTQNGISDADGFQTRLELVPELKLWVFDANAVMNVKEMELYVPMLNEDGENKFTAGALREMNFSADILPVWDLLTPRAVNVDNDARLSLALKYQPGVELADGTHTDPAFLPGAETHILLLRHGPLDSMVSLKASMHLDPELLSEGTYLPRLAQISLKDGWYIGSTDGSLQLDLAGEIGVRGEVIRQQPEAPLENLGERVKLGGFIGAELTIRGQAPQKPQPKR